MPTYNDHGIVLNSYDLAEADKILNIYTKDNGLVRAVAKGVKKPRGSLRGKVDQLSCCFFQFAIGKNLDVISDCMQVNSFSLLRSNLVRLTYGLLFLEIVGSFAYEKESESAHVYELLYSSLEQLQKIEEPDLFSIKFILEFLSIHGLKPQLETCVSCSQEVNKELDFYSYSTVLGGLLCKECSHLMDCKLVGANVLQVLESQSVHDKEGIRLALDLLIEHVNIRAKNKIKSFELLVSL